MQLPQKQFGSQNSIKQLFRQYSTTFKNTSIDKNIPMMTQSSNLPFDKFYNAFNSTGHIKNLTLDRFKHSEAKSIIEKLMQTKQFTPKNKEQELALLNQIQNFDTLQQKGPIPLSKTQHKIFCEVINLISEIETIQERTQNQNEEFAKLKLKLKKEGIELPESEQKPQTSHQVFKRYSSKELQEILESNDKMQGQIDVITKQLTNSSQQNQAETPLESIISQNSLLKKELSIIKNQIINAGEIDDQDIFQLNNRIEELKQSIFILEQKRMGKLTEADEELKNLKDQNQNLRSKTIELLKASSHPPNLRKSEAIQILKFEEDQKRKYFEEMSFLKVHYENLLKENSRLKSESLFQGEPRYGTAFQVQSKVSPFQNHNSEYRESYEKENYLLNYEPKRTRKTEIPLYENQFLSSQNQVAINYDSRKINNQKSNPKYQTNSYENSPGLFY